MPSRAVNQAAVHSRVEVVCVVATCDTRDEYFTPCLQVPQVVRTAGQAVDPLAAYRPAAINIGIVFLLGAASNAALTVLTAWTGERFGTRLKASLFRVVMSQDQVRRQCSEIDVDPIYITQQVFCIGFVLLGRACVCRLTVLR